DSVTEIGRYAFCECGALKELEGGTGLESIREHGFDRSALETYPFSASPVKFIGANAFHGCSIKDKSLVFSDSIQTIQEHALYLGTESDSVEVGVESVSIPSSIRTLGTNSFGSYTSKRQALFYTVW
ncbi:MAG: leucine-rich repeat domain-containing protein, partial [Firmicutes bacterium]|nr:leucine-rich repeat domain-containing protein [Bacillota bacterium]